MSDPPGETRLYRMEPGTWGVPSRMLAQVEYVLDTLRRDFDMGHGVASVRWFHDADASAREGDQDVLRKGPGLLGFVDRDEPDTVWLRRELCDGPAAALTRTLVHEVMHCEQLARGSPLPVAELEREADDLMRILCRGLPP